MIPYLNDTEAWNRQGEAYLSETRNKPPVHPGIAFSTYASRTAARFARSSAAGRAYAPESRDPKEMLAAAR